MNTARSRSHEHYREEGEKEEEEEEDDDDEEEEEEGEGARGREPRELAKYSPNGLCRARMLLKRALIVLKTSSSEGSVVRSRRDRFKMHLYQ